MDNCYPFCPKLSKNGQLFFSQKTWEKNFTVTKNFKTKIKSNHNALKPLFHFFSKKNSSSKKKNGQKKVVHFYFSADSFFFIFFCTLF